MNDTISIYEAFRSAYSAVIEKLEDEKYRRFAGNYELIGDLLDEAFFCGKTVDAIEKIMRAYSYVPRSDEETRGALVNLVIAIARGDEYE